MFNAEIVQKETRIIGGVKWCQHNSRKKIDFNENVNLR